MNIVYFIIILQIFNIILISSIILINKFNDKNKNNISHKKVTANNLTYNCNKNNISHLYGNNSLPEHFEPYDGSYTNGFSVNNVLCSNFDVSKSLTTTADMTFYNTTENSSKTDKNKTITISKDGNITIKSIDNIKIQEETNKEVKTLLQVLYPKGSIYMSMNSTSPATFIGGEWVLIQNRFLLSVPTDTDAKTEGGSDTITTDHLPSHSHSIDITSKSSGSHEHNVVHKWLNKHNKWVTRYFNNQAQVCTDGCSFDDGDINLRSDSVSTWNKTVAESAGSHTHKVEGSTRSTGNGKSYKPPYITCYIWYRTK